jgi:penicillin-binding protein 1A
LATINLVNEIGLANIYKELKKFGFENLPMDLSLSLGSLGISPFELAGFYSIFSNYGNKVKPKLILQVNDKYGDIVLKNDTLEKSVKIIIDYLKEDGYLDAK